MTLCPYEYSIVRILRSVTQNSFGGGDVRLWGFLEVSVRTSLCEKRDYDMQSRSINGS